MAQTAIPAPEKQEQPEIAPGLDQLKAELSSLKGAVGDKAEQHEAQLRLAFDKDMEELKIEAGDARDKLWAEVWGKLKATPDWTAMVENKVEKSGEKGALDKFVEDLENLDGIKEAIDKAEGNVGMVRQFVNYLEEKWNKSEFSKKIGWSALATFIGGIMVQYADAALKKMETGDGSIIGNAMKKPFLEGLKALGVWILPENQERIKELEEGIKKDFEAKKYNDAQKKVDELLKLDKKNAVAKEYGEKLKTVPATEVGTEHVQPSVAEFAAQKQSIDAALNAYPRNIVFETITDDHYRALVQEYGDATKAAAGITAAKPSFEAVRAELQEQDELKDGKFQFSLEDVALLDKTKNKDETDHLLKALSGATDATFTLKDKKPETLRKFMRALKTKDATLEEFRKTH